MKCYLCGSENNHKREGKVRDDASINILECDECGLVFLDKQKTDESFYKEGNMRGEGYKKAVLTLTQGTTLISEDNERRVKFCFEMIKDKDILDFGSGQAHFLLRAKDYAKSVTGLEIEEGVATIYEKHNIPLVRSLDELSKASNENEQRGGGEGIKYDTITLFHVLAHLKEPINILNKLSKLLKNDGKIIIETPNSADMLLSYYQNEAFSNFFYQKCMLYYFNAHNLNHIAQKAGLKVEFIKGVQRYPLSNTLYWLAKSKPAGQKQWGNFIDNEILQNAYEQTLASLGATDTLIAMFSRD